MLETGAGPLTQVTVHVKPEYIPSPYRGNTLNQGGEGCAVQDTWAIFELRVSQALDDLLIRRGEL